MVTRIVVVALLLASCKFSETVSAPPSPPFIVVQGVLNAGESHQFITVERAEGGSTSGESGALVEVTHLDPRQDPLGDYCVNPTVTLSEVPEPQPGVSMKGVYVTQDLCRLHPGDR